MMLPTVEQAAAAAPRQKTEADAPTAAFVRLIVALAFVTGSTAFVGLVVPIVVGVATDYVPVLPVAVVLVLALGFAGGIAAAIGAARTWWTFLLGLGLGTFAGMLAAVAAQAVLFFSLQGTLTWGVRPFDADTWREATTDEIGYNPRGKMVATLLMTGKLHGADRSDVADLLGAPDCGTDDGEDAWHIGLWSGLQFQPDCLHVAYDDGTVTAITTRRH